MGHPSQQLAQTLAGALHAHLERGDAYTGERGHLLVTELLDVVQQERFTLFRHQLAQRLLDLFSGATLDRRLARKRVLQRHLVAHEPALAPVAPDDEGAALVDDDAIQPAGEPTGVPAARDGPLSPQERRLECVVGVRVAAEHPHREAGVRVAMAVQQYAERLRVSTDDGGDQCGVGTGIHTTLTAQPASRVTRPTRDPQKRIRE